MEIASEMRKCTMKKKKKEKKKWIDGCTTIDDEIEIRKINIQKSLVCPAIEKKKKKKKPPEKGMKESLCD